VYLTEETELIKFKLNNKVKVEYILFIFLIVCQNNEWFEKVTSKTVEIGVMNIVL
jgi:hypothetical protein